MRQITLHHNPAIPWHRKRLPAMHAGLEVLGFGVTVTQSQFRINADPAVLFGTSNYKAIEDDRGDYLLIDRACWSDPDFVRLGWNGRGLHANYMVPDEPRPLRFYPFAPVPAPKGDRIVLCEDYDGGPNYQWATHLRPHPARGGDGPVRLASTGFGMPVVHDFAECKLAIVGNSTVAFEALAQGVPVKIVGSNNMASLSLDYLAWCQWSWLEIERGEPIRHLFECLK